MKDSELTGLGYYIKDTLFGAWQKERQSSVEKDMQIDLDAFNGVTEGFWKADETEGWRSDTTIQITKMKVLTAYSMVIDILLQGGKIPFTFKSSPWDRVVFDELPDEQRQAVENSIDDMKALIEQQFGDCHADRQLMKCVMAAAIYGEAYGKYYVHEVERFGFEQSMDGQDLWEPTETMVTSPAWEYISNWSVYRDLETEDMQAGQGVIQRGMMSPYELRQKKDGGEDSLWIDDAIDLAIESADQPEQTQGSKDTSTLPPGMRNIKHRHKTMQSLEFWGRVPRIIAKEFEAELKKGEHGKSSFDFTDFEHDGDEVEIMALMADNEVVRYSRNKPSTRPFYRMLWEIALDETSGTGIPKNLRSIQKVINGGVRAFEDNKKLSANVVAAVKRQFLPNWDGKFVPGTELEVSDECDDAGKAIQQIIIQDVGQSLLDLIGLFERYSDEASQIPKILQGAVHDKQKADTLGEMNMLQANAGKYIGGVIKNFDEGLVEPAVTDFYQYNMQDPGIKKGKGNYIAQALGFTSFQNQVIRLQKLMQGLNLVLNSEVLLAETKVRDVLEEIWKAFDIDPAQTMKTEEEKQADAQGRAQMQAEEEAKIKALVQEENAMEEQSKDREHARKMDEIDAKIKGDIDKLEEKFENDLVLKKVEQNKPEKPKEAQSDQA